MDEFKLIEKYIKTKPDSSIVLGVGDDCCILEQDQEYYRITTSDALVEHKHFRLNDINFKDLGYKALTVNLSDISAMGGEAKWCQLTLALPPQVNEESVAQFFEGFYELAEQENISLVGGDLSSSDRDVFINVTLSGLVKKDLIKRREDFSQGELLCVTGYLGDSAAGLRCLLENKNEGCLIQKHIRPKAYHKEGQWLAGQGGVKGMMDLSDGILSDLQRLNCGFEIDLEKLPLSDPLKKACDKYRWNCEELALAGGEDYVLLFSCRERDFESLKYSYKEAFSSDLYCIGKVSENSREIVFQRNNKRVKIDYEAFSHF